MFLEVEATIVDPEGRNLDLTALCRDIAGYHSFLEWEMKGGEIDQRSISARWMALISREIGNRLCQYDLYHKRRDGTNIPFEHQEMDPAKDCVIV
jgi:hypothetical protein